MLTHSTAAVDPECLFACDLSPHVHVQYSNTGCQSLLLNFNTVAMRILARSCKICRAAFAKFGMPLLRKLILS